MTIHFGTDGWRAVISDTFTFNNLRMLTQAIADAVASESPGTNPGTAAPFLTRKSSWWVSTRVSSPTAMPEM